MDKSECDECYWFLRSRCIYNINELKPLKINGRCTKFKYEKK